MSEAIISFVTQRGAVRRHAMPFGAEVRPEGVRFRLWAPAEERVMLLIGGVGAAIPMEPIGDGWHERLVAEAGPGSRYRYRLGSGLVVPDPASRHQPEDVHGPSEVIDPAAHRWADGGWTGRPWHEAVVYELHVGTFTPEGTFRAAISRLDHLVALGITAIEIMPVGDFPGRCNWGYDGVQPFAPDAVYGRPEELKAFIEAAHARGLMVLLDVVYNHFGSDGNYFGVYAPALFSQRHETPWGDALNFDGPGSGPVRAFMIHNALYWLEEFNLDGLRLDAVHNIMDDSPLHLLDELAESVQALAPPGRSFHLVLENADNAVGYLRRGPDGESPAYDAQWNDDVHHALHVAVTGESAGYYAAFAGNTDLLGRSLAQGFCRIGEPRTPVHAHDRTGPSGHLPPTAFIAFLQNHDQIGNRAFGDRIAALAKPAAVRAAACLYLLCPQIPMLFMGEEWAAAQPFPFFCDPAPEIAKLVREGRLREWSHFPEYADPNLRATIPDPTDYATFRHAKLTWDDRLTGRHAEWLGWYRRILALRHAEIVPRLRGIVGDGGRYRVLGRGRLWAAWRMGDGSLLSVVANLSAEPMAGAAGAEDRLLWQEGEWEPLSRRLGPWAVRWMLSAAPPAP